MSKTALGILAIGNQPEENSMLYRYVTIDKLFDFLINGRLPLVRLNLFEDRLEGVSIEHLLLNYASDEVAKHIGESVGGYMKRIGLNINPTKRNSLRRRREVFQNTNYANCWYINDHESVAMWQLYSSSDSVAIRIPYSLLTKEITNQNFHVSGVPAISLKFGNISYYKLNDIDGLSDLTVNEDVPGFVKDYSFQHEQEFRMMIETENVEPLIEERKAMVLDEQIEQINKKEDERVVYIDLFNFKQLPFEIVFHPQSSDWHRKNVMSLLDKYGLTFKTCQSSLKEIFKR